MSPDLEFLRPEIHPDITHEPESWLIHHDEGELAVDVFETARAIFIKTAIAGIDPEKLSLSLSHDMLTIRGERHDVGADKEDRQYLCRECHWGTFSRTIILPADVNVSKAEAIFKSGILAIKLPKTKKKEDIKVKVEDE